MLTFELIVLIINDISIIDVDQCDHRSRSWR